MQPRRYLFFITQSYSFAILRPLQTEIRKRGHQVHWFIYDPELKKHIHADETQLNTKAEVMHYQPEAVFVPGNWVPHFFPGVKVQVFHGFGIEKKGHFRVRGFFDLYCTHGPLTTDGFLKLREPDPHFAVVETGWPKVDPLFQLKNLKPADKPIILYAPTFSPSLCSAEPLLSTIKKLSHNIAWKWCVKFHPKMDADLISAYQAITSNNLEVVKDADILPLLQRADVLLSDTSSVVAEFCLLDKPVITYRTMNPGEQSKNITEAHQLEGEIIAALNADANQIKKANTFSQQMHPYRDGLSSARVLDATQNFITSPPKLKAKPFNFLRKLKARWAMRSF